MAIQRISVNKTNHAIRWIVIYPVDSVIQPLNNRGQKYMTLWWSLPLIHVGHTGLARLPSMFIKTDITYTKPPTSRNTARVLGSRSNTFSRASRTSVFSFSSERAVECIKLRRVPIIKPNITIYALTINRFYNNEVECDLGKVNLEPDRIMCEWSWSLQISGCRYMYYISWIFVNSCSQPSCYCDSWAPENLDMKAWKWGRRG